MHVHNIISLFPLTVPSTSIYITKFHQQSIPYIAQAFESKKQNTFSTIRFLSMVLCKCTKIDFPHKRMNGVFSVQ